MAIALFDSRDYRVSKKEGLCIQLRFLLDILSQSIGYRFSRQATNILSTWWEKIKCLKIILRCDSLRKEEKRKRMRMEKFIFHARLEFRFANEWRIRLFCRPILRDGDLFFVRAIIGRISFFFSFSRSRKLILNPGPISNRYEIELCWYRH